MITNRYLTAAAIALQLFFFCSCEKGGSPSGEMEVSFSASALETRTIFAPRQGDTFPVLWTENENGVAISLNGAEAVKASITPTADGSRAYFKATFPAAAQYSFRAMSPASAVTGLGEDGFTFALPKVQTPLEGSVDPAAMVIEASEGPFTELSGEVELHFQHKTSYGILSFGNLNTSVSGVDIVWPGNDTLSLSTSRRDSIWFSTVPRGISGKEVEFIAYGTAGKYSRKITFPEGKSFEKGRVVSLEIDMASAAFTPASSSISILAVGNSFSVDAMQYLYGYLAQMGYEDIFLGNLYIGGCTLQTHAGNIESVAGAYTYYTNSSGSWTNVTGKDAVSAMTSRSWDYVSLQQASGYSGVKDSYDPYLASIVSAIRQNCPGAKLMWHMTWAYQANSGHSDFPKYGCVQRRMYEAIVSTVKEKVIGSGSFDFVIPSGTAIQNLRTSFLGDKVTRDGYHMSYDAGRMTTALMWAKQISGGPVSGVSLNTSGYSVDSKTASAIKDAVEKAYANPYAVTPSACPDEGLIAHKSSPELCQAMIDAGYDISKYEELEYKITPYAYYNSTSSNYFASKAAGSTASNINQFAATPLFSQEDIPAGSIIVLKKGYQYRPERWTRLSAKNSSSERPANVKASSGANVFVVDDSWWDGYAYRAFNLAEESNPGLSDERMIALRSTLSIFIPR